LTDSSTKTRLARVIQQLKAFDTLHADELHAMAEELRLAGFSELATKLRTYTEVQRDEAHIVMDELVDIHREMTVIDSDARRGSPQDPAAGSPRRAKWLAEQAAAAQRLEELKQPLSRRDLLGRVSPQDQSS
jgi:hypothetical protein